MKLNGGGVILNIASIAASAGLKDRFAYSMSAVVAMTYSVAKDYLIKFGATVSLRPEYINVCRWFSPSELPGT
jgi:NAD(P)-dependent dehydrogenase (short-subunit alcohol dehydrogenase family)